MKLKIIYVCLVLIVCGVVLGTLSSPDPQVTRHFRLSEFTSPDTGEAKMDMEVILKLQAVRDHFGKNVVVLSGYRTPAHNRNVRGHRESLHMRERNMVWKVKKAPT